MKQQALDIAEKVRLYGTPQEKKLFAHLQRVGGVQMHMRLVREAEEYIINHTGLGGDSDMS